MATKVDILTGASVTQGYGYESWNNSSATDDTNSSATRYGIVTGLAGTRADRDTAIATFKAALGGNVHPDHSTWYLTSINCVPFIKDPTKALCVARYHPKRNIMYSSSTGSMELPWYKDAAGASLTAGPDGVIRPRRKLATTRSLSFAHTFFQSSAPSQFDSSVNKTNSATYTFTNYGSFSANTVLFNGTNITSRIMGATPYWIITYSFTIRYDGWVESYLDANNVAQERDMYERGTLPTVPSA